MRIDPHKLRSVKTFGQSMFPLLHDGDIVYFKKIPYWNVKLNDIVAVKKGHRLATHRVIYKTPTYFITKGDNNLKADTKNKPSDLIGKVYQVKRGEQVFDPEDIYLYQSTLYFQEIVKVKNILEKNNIQFVFLKGLPLHLYFEKSHPRRYYSDCDILIDKKQLKKVERILSKMGYKKNDASYSKIQKRLKDKETEISFFKQISGMNIIFDIHLEPVFLMVQIGKIDPLYPQQFVDELACEFLQNKQRVKIDNQAFPILSPAHLILYLALHFFHDNYAGYHKLYFLSVVTKYFKHDNTTLQLLTGIIVRYKLRNFVFPTFYFLKKYYDDMLPVWFVESIKPESRPFRYFGKSIRGKSIFDELTRVKSGMLRFKHLFYLSPNPGYKKLFILFNVQVVFMVLWILKKRYLSLRALR